MGSGYSKMKKQARAFEEQYEKFKDQMKTTLVTGSAGNGLVTVTLNGEKELQEVKIKPECVDPNDLEGLQDLIKAAHADAHKKLADQEDSSGLPAGLGLPAGFSL